MIFISNFTASMFPHQDSFENILNTNTTKFRHDPAHFPEIAEELRYLQHPF